MVDQQFRHASTLSQCYLIQRWQNRNLLLGHRIFHFRKKSDNLVLCQSNKLTKLTRRDELLVLRYWQKYAEAVWEVILIVQKVLVRSRPIFHQLLADRYCLRKPQEKKLLFETLTVGSGVVLLPCPLWPKLTEDTISWKTELLRCYLHLYRLSRWARSHPIFIFKNFLKVSSLLAELQNVKSFTWTRTFKPEFTPRKARKSRHF